MIKICNLSFKYKNSNNILDNINLEIQEGETIAIVGENGSGKSTLAKLISGILKTKHGKIIIDDLDLSKKEEHKKAVKKVGIVFQNPENQIIFNNIYDELSFALKNLSKEEIDARITNSLKKVNMYDFINKDLYELSLGQKQRVAIAEILAKKPKYIIFDEPTTMIDSTGKEQIYDIIKNLKKEGYTIIYTSNLAEEILLADRILILKNGQIVNEIKRENLMAS
ncbi:MAG: ATP-binding cassette domain-containing protein, partial [Clostridia bacterium]|nr:ATP-binding cassette domain-containing protein [Clostridia bacterium]